jgi:ABC-type transporter Mla subunit MlaD
MADSYSLQDVVEHIDTLLTMMSDHEEDLYGAIDMVNQVRDEISHLISENNDDEE